MADQVHIDAALEVYLHHDDSPYPRRDSERVVALFDANQGFELLAVIDAMISEMWLIPVDWNSLGWVPGLEYVKDVMRRRHPELTETALDLLDWHYSWVMR